MKTLIVLHASFDLAQVVRLFFSADITDLVFLQSENKGRSDDTTFLLASLQSSQRIDPVWRSIDSTY